MTMANHMDWQSTRRGIYETFDFRGASANGRYAFILRHSVMQSMFKRHRYLQVSIFLFDRHDNTTRVVVEQTELTSALEKQLKRLKNWDEFTLSFSSGSFVTINRQALRGKLHTAQGSAQWQLNLQRQDEEVNPVVQPLGLSLPWPRHKVQVRDCALSYQGHIEVMGMAHGGVWQGSNHHYTGDGYPYEYAAGQASQFEQDEQSFFYGVSTRLNVGGLVTSPYLNIAVLKYQQRWYQFNQFSRLSCHHVEALDNYRWRVRYVGREYALDVDVNGANPRLVPWTAWHSDQPLGGRVVVKMTPFAEAKLCLYRRHSKEVIANLHTQTFELKTLLPENNAELSGFLAQP